MAQDTPMVIIAGYYRTDVDRRDEVVQRFRDLVARTRAADGCLHCGIDADSVDPDRITMVEVWRDVAALDAWRARADPPDIEFPMRDEHIGRYDAVDGGPLFP
jgi:quinol monooxygenase YgiN